jgi:phosphatidylglycerol---prolipoprotein diacylglyceryl transferase
MMQEIFTIPIPFFDLRLPIYGYGLMMVIGFLLAAHLAKYLARRCNLDGEVFVNAALMALFAGIVGARVSHIIENFREFTDPKLSAWQNFVNMINLRSGGLTYYGGFLLAFPTLVIYGIKKKVPIRLGMDIVAPCLMIGLGFGRIGCFLNGCCQGAPCPADAAYAVHFPYYSGPYLEEWKQDTLKKKPPDELVGVEKGKPVLLTPAQADAMHLTQLRLKQHSNWLHPAQLYCMATALLLAGICVAFFTVRRTPGLVFALMMVLEGMSRYVLEMVRAEPPVLGQLSLSMVLGIALVALGIVLWLVFRRMGPAQSMA